MGTDKTEYAGPCSLMVISEVLYVWHAPQFVFSRTMAPFWMKDKRCDPNLRLKCICMSLRDQREAQ